MPEFNPYSPPEVPLPAAPSEPIIPPYQPGGGLGGWLILLGVAVAVSPFIMLRHVAETVKAVFMSDMWKLLTSPDSESYHALWAPFLIGEIGFNVLSMVVSSYMVYLFFAKKKSFPSWYIWGHAVTLVVQIVDVLLLQVVMPGQPLLDPETSKELTRSVMGIVVWVPYLLLSKRVALTFTR